MKTQEQTILTTYSKRIYSVGEPAATAGLEVLKEETRPEDFLWHLVRLVAELRSTRDHFRDRVDAS